MQGVERQEMERRAAEGVECRVVESFKVPAAMQGSIVGEMLSSRFGCGASGVKPASPQNTHDVLSCVMCSFCGFGEPDNRHTHSNITVNGLTNQLLC